MFGHYTIFSGQNETPPPSPDLSGPTAGEFPDSSLKSPPLPLSHNSQAVKVCSADLLNNKSKYTGKKMVSCCAFFHCPPVYKSLVYRSRYPGRHHSGVTG